MGRTWGPWLVVWALIMSPVFGVAADLDALHKQVFGVERQNPVVELSANLILDRSLMGRVDVQTRASHSTVHINASQFVEYATSRLTEEGVVRLKAAVTGERLSSKTLTEIGYRVAFDRKHLVLKVETPYDERQERSIALSDTHYGPRPGDLMPADTSGVVNMASYWTYANTATESENWVQTSQFDGALNLSGLVFESSLHYRSSGAPTVALSEPRVVKDDTNLQTRFTLGELGYPTIGSLFGTELIGVGATKSWEDQPIYDRSPDLHHTLVLREAALVDFIINGRNVKQLDLAPGTYDFSSFPFEYGYNQVVLRVHYSSGRIEYKTLNFVEDLRLLEKNQNQFTANIGYPVTSDIPLAVDSAGLSGVFYYQFGLSDAITFGSYYHAGNALHMIGSEALFGTQWGLVGFDAATSIDDQLGSGFTTGLMMSGYTTPSQTGFELPALKIQYLGPNFKSTPSTTSNDVAVIVQPSILYRFDPDTFASFSSAINLKRHNLANTFGGTSRLGKRWGDWTGELSAQCPEIQTGTCDWIYRVNVAWTPFRSPDQYRSRYTLSSGKTELTWNHQALDEQELHNEFHIEYEGNSRYAISNRTKLDRWRTAVQRRQNLGAATWGVDTQYDDEMGRIQAQIDWENGRHTRSSVGVESAIVFADGVVAVSRPVHDSFMILVPHDGIRSGTIRFNNGTEMAGRPIVIHDLQSYYSNTLTVSSADIPIGASLGSGAYSLYPSYRSGKAITIGSSGSVLLVTYLHDADGHAIAYESGEIVSKSDPTKRFAFFTNKKGRMAVLGLSADQSYIVTISGSEYKPFEINIPKNAVGKVKKPVMTVKKRGQTK